MPSIEMVRDWQGRTMIDQGGDRVGRIQEIYLDMQTDEPEWALVNTGLFGLRSTFVPIQDARESGDDVVVPFSKERIHDAPGVEPHCELTEAEEDRLYSYYGVPPVGRRMRRWLVTEYPAAGPPGPDGVERVVIERELLGNEPSRDPGR